jgi:hypothetical protein
MLRDDRAMEVFQRLIDMKVGNGNDISFWTDSWIGGRTATDIAPLVVGRVSTRCKNRRTAAEGLEGNRWLLDIQGDLSDEGRVQCVRLWALIQSINRDVSEPDKFTWKEARSGVYSARATYRSLCQEEEEFCMAAPIWGSFATLKCKIFAWLAIKYRLWTSDRRVRHGLQEQSDPCFLCLQEEDSVDHILMQCSYARQVWHGGLQRAGLRIEEPNEHSRLETWWLEVRGRIRVKDRPWFDTLVILTSWTVWKQRNARVFGNTSEECNTGPLIDRIHDELSVWVSARAGGRENRARE